MECRMLQISAYNRYRLRKVRQNMLRNSASADPSVSFKTGDGEQQMGHIRRCNRCKFKAAIF